MSSKELYCYNIFKIYSMIVDFDGDVDRADVPSAVDGETFEQWKLRVLGDGVKNVVVYAPFEPSANQKVHTLQKIAQAEHLEQVFRAGTFSLGSEDANNIEHIRQRIDSYLQSLEKQMDALTDKFQALCSKMMVKGSHGFEEFPGLTIGEAAKAQALKFAQSEDKNGAHILMDVVLAANRNYERAVKKNIQSIKNLYPNLTLSELARLIENNDFRSFKEIWGHADEKKYLTLKNLVHEYLNLYPTSDLDDIGRMRQWAFDAKIEHWNSDPIGKIRNVGVATFQHLRLALGVDTVKPDQRVMEVLIEEFGAPLNIGEIGAVLAVEKLSKLLKLEARFIDQVFVKYGSGYYQKTPKIT